MAGANLTAERLHELLDYDPITGNFAWRIWRHGCKSSVGHLRSFDGRITIRIDGKYYAAHRLAYFYMLNEWPKHQIDHIDGDPANNAFGNLRDVSISTNQENRKRAQKNSRSGLLGVCLCGGRIIAQISIQGARRHLGYFKTTEEAHAAYITAKRQLHRGNTL